jgi:hypothetical protein
MKYYIVSEEELNELSAAWAQLFLIERAEAACRARELPGWATHYVRDLEGPLDYGLYHITGSLEIKR